jgi:DNA-directed RNA polymerase specialized sigma24 family protein
MEALVLVMAADDRREAVKGLLALGGQAYQLAAHVLDSSASAEDAVQGAYLSALEHMPSGLPPEEARVWFLKVVANAARKHLRGELRRKGREAAVLTERARASAGSSATQQFTAKPDRCQSASCRTLHRVDCGASHGVRSR